MTLTMCDLDSQIALTMRRVLYSERTMCPGASVPTPLPALLHGPHLASALLDEAKRERDSAGGSDD